MRLTSAISLFLPAFFCIFSPAFAADAFQIETLSNHPHRLSGNDALIRVKTPQNVPPSAVRIHLNGTDITSSFRDGEAGGLTGLVSGMRIGANALQVLQDSQVVAEQSLVNFPIVGPVFSGPHQKPYICGTAKFKLPDGASLGEPLDENCSVKTVVTYMYKSRNASSPETAFRPLSFGNQLPLDVAETETTDGKKVPYVVRIETGTINRAIYQTAILHNPASEPEPSPFTSPQGWNRKFLYTFGGGCTGGWYRQGSSLASLLNDQIVGRGYAEAVATLNVFGTNCQDMTASETMMMVKERFIEAYGVPEFTFGRGGSGGAYQQIQIADNYPGLLDGIIPSATFPEVLATTQYLTDVQLFHRYFSSGNHGLSEEQQKAVSGVGTLKNVTGISRGAQRIHPMTFCPEELPEALRYHPVKNPTGARCDVFDHTVNVYGRDPETGFARRPIDNVGVQYGLNALKMKQISVREFLDLNEKIGGYDNDGEMVATRSQADLQAVRAAYQTGRITNAGGGLAKIPIIDFRAYTDLTKNGDVHLKYHSFAFRERLRLANGNHDNQVMLTTPAGEVARNTTQYAIDKMVEWLTNLKKDQSSDPAREKVIRAKPADLVDSCYSASGERIIESQTFTGGKCNELYPAFPSPRMVAGGPITNNILKCQLKPIDLNEYSVPFSTEEKQRLEKIFPDGVCDWSKPGVEQQNLVGTWLKF